MTPTQERQQAISEAKASLERMQNFETATLARESELGVALNFKDAVPHATRLIDLYKQLPLDSLEWFNVDHANQIKSVADSDYKILNQILSFDPRTGQGQAERTEWIYQLERTYEETFRQLAPFIAYGAMRVTDFTKFGHEARATIQDIQDKAKKLGEDMKQLLKEAEDIMVKIREVAAKQGVSQQAVYFLTESDRHAEQAEKWLKRTKRLTILLALYAALSLVLHKIPWIAPTTSYETIQLAVSKVLVFTTIAYFLILSAKNFIAHRHNAIVNKHRQNALVTYEALVKAAGDSANRDIVLTKAAECIFGPQPTGFGKADAGEPGAISMVSLSPGAIKPSVSNP